MYTKHKIVLILFAMLLSISSCETLDLDVNNDPNNASPSNSDINLLLNGALLNFTNWIGEEDEDNRDGFEAGMEVIRMLHMYGPLYDNAYTPGEFDDIWTQAYAGHLSDIKTIKSIASENELYHHIGVAQIIESYTLTVLVDYFGDVPYSEALLGAENFNPKLDDSESVYAEALSLLNEAIANLNLSPANSIGSTGDLFYFGETEKWVTLAKTLKLRIYNNTRLVNPNALTEINLLLADEDLIDSADEDFTVFYGTDSSAPDTRHPQYINNYENTPSGEYMSLYFMNLMINGFDTPDPRLRYYFYRQVSEYPASDAQGIFDFPCLAESYPLHYTPGQDPFCTSIGNGYWGRIHGDAQGLPSDSDKITTWGTYPIGGKFDDDSFTSVNNRAGMGGAGIQPIILSSFVHFMRAESALVLNTTDDAVDQLEKGIRASIAKVTTFDSTLSENEFAASENSIETYVADILADFAVASDEEKLNIIMTQAYIASWGNPIEAYNNYRRTGMPNNLQPTQEPAPGVFIRSFNYPSAAIENNPNITPKANQGVKVFWDVNTTNLDF